MQWDHLMDAALLADKHEFVNLFLDHAVVDVDEYLNEDRLLKLYNQSKEVYFSICRPVGATVVQSAMIAVSDS